MSRRGRVLWTAALAAAFAVAGLGQQITYVDRLRVPVLQDDIGYGQAVAVDPATSEIFVCDSRTNRILIFDKEGYFTFRILGGELFSSPLDLAVDPEGLLLVVANRGGRRLPVELDFDGVFRREVPVRGIDEGLRRPLFVSIALSPSGERIYLLDDANHRLWITDRQGEVQTSVDLGADVDEDRRRDLFFGQVDVYGEYVLVARTSEGEILRFDLDGNPVDHVGLKGSARCHLGRPTAAALNDRGEFLVLDQQRMLLSRWSPQGNRCLGEYIGIGAAPGYLYYPFDLALDLQGRLYIAQSFEGRVQVYEGMGVAPMQLAARRPAPGEPAETATARVEVGELQPAEPQPAEPQTAEPQPAEPGSAAPVEAVVAEVPETPAVAGEPSTGEPVPGEAVAEQPAAEPPAAQPAPAAAASAFAAQVIAGARQWIERAPRYDPDYVEIAYPGGDVPADRGAAVDLVIRAFRQAGVDLQRAVHEDILGNLSAYGVHEPDPNIDHRRLRNLQTYFERHTVSLPTGADADWAAGDVVFLDRNDDGIAGHVGILSDEAGPSGMPRVFHHHRPEGEFSGRPSADDVLLRWPVVGHYRWPAGPGEVVGRAEPAAPPAAGAGEAAEELAAVEQTVRAWARAWSEKNVDDYLAFYSEAFEPGQELTRSGWEALRRARIERPRSIRVSLDRIEPRLTAGDRAQVAFVQTYSSDLIADKVDKILVLRREGGGWRIVSERVVRTSGE